MKSKSQREHGETERAEKGKDTGTCSSIPGHQYKRDFLIN